MEFESADPSVVRSIKQRDLLNTWLRLYARDQKLPSIVEYRPERIEDEMPDLVFFTIDATQRPPHIIIDSDGTRMASAYGHTGKGRRLEDYLGPSLAPLVMPIYYECIRRRLPAYTIAHVDEVIGWARQQVRERFGETGYELHYIVYGRNGVMGDLEPLRDRPGHELCILVQGVAPTAVMAEEVCMIGTRQMFYARLPEVKGSAGSVAFALDEVLRASPGYRWTVNHTLRCGHPLELFPTHMTTVGS